MCSAGGEGREQALPHSGEMPGPSSRTVSTASPSTARTVTDSAAPAGLCLIALCSRLRVSSCSIHWCARTATGSSMASSKSSALSATRGDRSSTMFRTTSPRSSVTDSGCWRNCSTFASESIWLASIVARSTVWLISPNACSGATSPRRADCTCALSTASGVRSWWALSRTKRFWWSSSRCSRPMTSVVASISGRSSRGASGESMGERCLPAVSQWPRPARAPSAWRGARRTP